MGLLWILWLCRLVLGGSYVQDLSSRFTESTSRWLGSHCGVPAESEPIFLTMCEGGNKSCPLAPINHYPWAVYVMGICSGTLISDRHVLTAAHCFYNLNDDFPDKCYMGLAQSRLYDMRDNYVYIGDNEYPDIKKEPAKSKRRRIKEVVIHPKWCTKNHASTIYKRKSGKPGFKKGRLLSIAALTANDAVTKATANSFHFTPKAGESACHGDSGGGLFGLERDDSKWKGLHSVIGLVSLGQGCGEAVTTRKNLKDSVTFTDVRRYVRWICEQTGLCYSYGKYRYRCTSANPMDPCVAPAWYLNNEKDTSYRAPLTYVSPYH